MVLLLASIDREERLLELVRLRMSRRLAVKARDTLILG